eukprot:TRINITY_DN2402_c0_g1_i1.p1 TRINITY_DN2402_c0_g1~~TRINITY_DN2402_c0_g1_i1.p1  ORF type:complete len:712 (+),score=190.22 TRINITY_DN2402_c0_g1_i1:189-2324(+)
MASEDGVFLTEEQRQLLRSASQGREAQSNPEIIKSPQASRENHRKHGTGDVTKTQMDYVDAKRDCASNSDKNGSYGGKGTSHGTLDTDDDIQIDYNDSNFDSEEEPYHLVSTAVSESLDFFKKKVGSTIEEYFATDDVSAAAADIKELNSPNYHYYFVKKLVSMAMDRHDQEKEMAAVLLSSLYADVIAPEQVRKGFNKLLEAADDLALDIPDAVDVLAVFVARAVVDDILPPAFLTKTLKSLPEDSKGVEVIHKAEKSYLSAPLHAEIIERKWGGTTHVTVEEVKKKIDDLLNEYVESGDKAEACHCIRDLNVPFYYHEVVKKALILAMERRVAEPMMLELLKQAAEEGLITSSQMSKGFCRLADTVDDLSLDIINAKDMFESLISKATTAGWLISNPVRSTLTQPTIEGHEDEAKIYKQRAVTIIQEYFLSDDISEVVRGLTDLAAPDFNALFVKRLIMLAMDRKNREKEMASVLLSSLYTEVLPVEDIVHGFLLLLESAEDTVLDIPVAGNELALFLARAVIDDILAPLDLEEIHSQLEPNSIGREIVRMSRSLLAARLAGERILRCWGGGTGWAVEDAKDKIDKLLEEFEAGGDIGEACQCIRDLDMPFFHHEVVKKALVMAMEKLNDRLLVLLHECYSEGLISINQMVKGFTRVADSLDDLALDIPCARQKFGSYVEQAKANGWLISSFAYSMKTETVQTNGIAAS